MNTYEQTLRELNAILASVERESVSLDELSTKLTLGFKLLDDLRRRLGETEAKIEEIISARTDSSKSHVPTNEE